MIHTLKILPEHFEDVKNGFKPFEIRLNDRNFQTGDILVLQEHSKPVGQTDLWFTGRSVNVIVNKVYQSKPFTEYFIPGLLPGFVLMSIKLQNS